MAEIQRTNYTHDAMIDLLIARPFVTQGEVALHFGYTQGWVSQVIRSDAFREMLAVRKKEIVDPLLLQSVEQRFEALVQTSLNILQQKLEEQPTADLALKTAELAARSLGMGVSKGVTNNMQFVVAMPEKAVTAKEWLAQHSPIAQVIDVAPG